MTMGPKNALRLQFLARVVNKECKHLATTDTRLFKALFTPEDVARLETDPDLAERVEAFVGRFGRLQGTVADNYCQKFWQPWVKKYLPRWTIWIARNAWACSSQLTNGCLCAASEIR